MKRLSMQRTLVPFVASIVIATSGVLSAWTAARQSEDASLLQRVRENLQKDGLIDELFTYQMLRRTYDVNLVGRLSGGPERLFEVRPSPADPTQVWRRLLAEDGTPLTAEERRGRDEKHRREVSSELRKRERESPGARARRLEKLEQERREELEQIEDVLKVYRLDRAGHENHGGDRLLVVTLTPRDAVKPVTKWGQRMKKFRGRALVDEGAAQLVQIEMEAIEEVWFGWGFIGRLHRGSRALYRRDRLPDGTWVPVEARFRGAGHTLMLIPFELETWARYFDYKRLDPETVAKIEASER